MAEEALQEVKKIAVLGGTGKEGKGLAYRWAKAGYEVTIGSRALEKAEQAAAELNEKLGQQQVNAMVNPDAAAWCDLAVLTVPYSAQMSMLESVKAHLTGKILINVTVPLVPPKVAKVQMPAAGSAAQEAQNYLGEQTSVVAAFQNISYERLLNDEEVDCDVLVCGTGKANRQVVIDLVRKAGMLGWDGGVIENAVVVEGMTSILIGLNKQFEGKAAGIKITGIND
ncbi:MAG: NADPH-dependent F420 reductase [Anaerolineaceae bacterium]|nr:NADPH-dependent F420 reductase [Anaerolineaceae bacterium]